MAERSGGTPPPSTPPAGPLVIRGGGTVGVQTDAMAAAAHRLVAIEHEVSAIAARARAVPSIVGAGSVLSPLHLEPDRGRAADECAHAVALQARLVRQGADDLGARFRRASVAYATAEDDARAGVENAVALFAATAGHLPGWVIGDVVAAAVAAWLTWTLKPGTPEQKSAAWREWMLENPRLVTSPEFVGLVRALVGAIDDGMTAPIENIVGPLVHDGRGVEAGGDAVLAAGSLLGLFRESDVRVRRVATAPTAPPTGIADRLRRVPEGNQIRIERYAAPGRSPHWVVYTDPTETFTPTATDEPWDLTSNVDGVSGHASGSFRATEAAMRDAGIGPRDPVAFVGYSQGALVAGMLAGSGRWNAQGLETFAGPVGNIPFPADLPGMNVRHTDDFVPALAGPDVPNGRLLVEQRAFPGEIPTYEVAPAHQRDSYDRTAAQIDAAESPEIRRQLAAMDRFAADPASRPGAAVESYLYHAERTGDERPAFTEPRVPRPYGERSVSPGVPGG